MIRIAVDAMSGDLGPRTAISAVLQRLTDSSGVCFILVGPRDELQALLPSDYPPSAIELHHAPVRVAMADDPRAALRHGRESSMWQALDLVRTGRADACVSAGNTGALMAIGRYLLKTLPGIARPAICKAMPVARGRTYMLDLGANIDCSPEQLHQFALMGAVIASTEQSARARIALLNVGVEAGKGPARVRAAHELLAADRELDYRGYIEASELYTGRTEVVVCDGFSGNVALKASEGVANLIRDKIQAGVKSRWWYRLALLPLRPLLRQWRRELNPGAYNGAIFLGLRQPVIKSHGAADAFAFSQALRLAAEQVEHRVVERIAGQIEKVGQGSGR